MTPDDRRAKVDELCDDIVARSPVHAEACAEIKEHVAKLLTELDATNYMLSEAEHELDEARERATEAEGRVAHDYDVPVWHEAKGRIMEGQDAGRVLEWVLSHLAGEPVLIS